MSEDGGWVNRKITRAGELDIFIGEPEKEERDRLHQAAWRGDVNELERLLSESKEYLNYQRRPSGATPLRVAAKNKQASSVALLLRYGAQVDLSDWSSLTPLFFAVWNRDIDSCVLLLQAGACPDGNVTDKYPPLCIACQGGFSIGLKLLLEYGADIECTHPLELSAFNRHLACFYLLLLNGIDLTPADQVLHVICSTRCDPMFVQLWVQFGGDLWERDRKGQLAVELPDNPHRDTILQFMENPVSLQSLCRLRIRKAVGRKRLHLLHTLDVAPVLIVYLTHRDIPQMNSILRSLESKLAKCPYIDTTSRT